MLSSLEVSIFGWSQPLSTNATTNATHTLFMNIPIKKCNRINLNIAKKHLEALNTRIVREIVKMITPWKS